MISVETAKSEIVDVIETIEKWIPMFEQGNAPAVLADVMELLDSQQAEIERLKDELNQYHKADTFLAVHGWQWKDDGTEHHTEQLKDGEQK